MVSRKCLSPDKALAAGIRTIRASSRLATRRGLRVILLGLGAGSGRDTYVVTWTGFPPHIPLETATRHGAVNSDAGGPWRHGAHRDADAIRVEGLYRIAVASVCP